jgi:hypothetical protein
MLITKKVAVVGVVLATLWSGSPGTALAFAGKDSIPYDCSQTILGVRIPCSVQIPAGRYGRTHESITRDAVNTLNSRYYGFNNSDSMNRALTEIINTNNNVDDDQTHAALHFDGESFPEGQARLLSLRASIVTDLQYGGGLYARAYLGSALHTIQDFYSHSN